MTNQQPPPPHQHGFEPGGMPMGQGSAREELARYAESLGRSEEPAPAPTIGSRLAGYALALVVGAAYGAIGTVSHVNTVTLTGFTIPLGLMIGVVGSIGLLIGLRLVFDDRIAALCAAVGMVGVVALLSLPSAGGTVLIPGFVGVIWTLTIVLSATLISVWPKLPARSDRAAAQAGGTTPSN